MAIIVVLLMAVWLAPGARATAGPAGEPQGTPSFLPIVSKALPPPPPQFLKNVALPDAQCPNFVGYNGVSNTVYVANNFSSNVSAFQNKNFLTNIAIGFWPTWIAADNDSPLTYVTALHDDTYVISGTSVVGQIPDHYEPYGVAVNPKNGYTYITDLDSTVQIVNGTQLITDLRVEDVQAGRGAGWLRPITIDPNSGLVYVASWDFGKMYVIDGTQVVGNPIQLGWGVIDMVVDSARGFIYSANDDPNATYPENLSVYNIATGVVTRISTADRSRRLALDPLTGYVYATNDQANSVTVLNGTQVVAANVPVGDGPFGVAVNPITGFAAVANQSSNNITILKNGAVVATIPAGGLRPFAVGVDTTNSDFYIANRGDEYGLFECNQASVTILD
jgi:YVTN family beta-propeller protein